MINLYFSSILIIVIIIWIWYIYLKHPKYKQVEYKEIKNKCKTGDIILFHGLDNINPIFIGTYYGHIGIVYIDPEDPENIPYIFEAFCPSTMPFYPSEFKNGIAISLLEHRLNSYRGYCFYKELNNPIQDNNKLLNFKEFINFALSKMYYEEKIFINCISKLLFNEALGYGTNCGEIVYLSLIKLGLLPEHYFRQNRTHHLLYLANIKVVFNNFYKEPVYVLSNYFKK